MSRADEKQEESDSECDESDDGYEDIENHSKGLETFINIPGLNNNDGSVGQYVPNAIHEFNLFSCCDARVKIDETLLLWYVVCPFIICSSIEEAFFPVWEFSPLYFHLGLVIPVRNNYGSSRFCWQKLVSRNVVCKLLAWHLIYECAHDSSTCPVVSRIYLQFYLVSSISCCVGLKGSGDENVYGAALSDLRIVVTIDESC